MEKQKLENLILYFLKNASNVSKTKLAKLLYYADFGYYKEHFQTITGTRYINLDFGPCPENLEMLSAKMKTAKKIIATRQKRYDVLSNAVAPDMTLFSANEKRFIKKVLNEYGDKTAKELTEKSHDEFPWKATKPYDEIPYALAQYIGVPMEAEPEPEDEFFRNSEKLEKAVDKMKLKRRVKESAVAV